MTTDTNVLAVKRENVDVSVVVEDETSTCGILFLGLDGAEFSSPFESDSLEPEISNSHITIIQSHL